jgi:hypothetical protein
MDNFAKISEEVAPKIELCRELEGQLNEANEALKVT